MAKCDVKCDEVELSSRLVSTERFDRRSREIYAFAIALKARSSVSEVHSFTAAKREATPQIADVTLSLHLSEGLRF